MENKPTSIYVGGKRHIIRPKPRELRLGGESFTIDQIACRNGGLIVGEGDTGKSTYAKMLCEEIAHRTGRRPVLVRLRNRPNPPIPELPEAEGVQTIILDGLDEYPECARDILEAADELAPERHRIWVTSRPCNAAHVLTGSDRFGDVYTLAPLGLNSIVEIAESAGIDSAKFLASACRAYLASFMSKPGGAVLMMQLFANNKLDVESDIELMEKIMLDFARETRDGDDAPLLTGKYSTDQIVAAAGWIAACLVFTSKDAVWTGPKSECPANDISLDTLSRREYDIELINHTIGTRLFEQLTDRRYRLAYSEMPNYLAGYWIVKNLPVDQVERLEDSIALPKYYEHCGYIIPQLDAISWASNYNPEYGVHFIGDYPSSFFRSHELIRRCGFDVFTSALCSYLSCDLVRFVSDGGMLQLASFADYLDYLIDRNARQKSAFIAAILHQRSVVADKYCKYLAGGAGPSLPENHSSEQESAARLEEGQNNQEMSDILLAKFREREELRRSDRVTAKDFTVDDLDKLCQPDTGPINARKTKRFRRKRFRASKNNNQLTQSKVAKDLGFSRSTINRWEKNQTEDGPKNKSNSYSYYRSLRLDPNLRGEYNVVVCYAKAKAKGCTLSFEQYLEGSYRHNPNGRNMH